MLQLARLQQYRNALRERANRMRQRKLRRFAMSQTMPAIFLGHGNPMNALLRNQYTEGWSRIGKSLPRPKAILCISAHWYVSETAVTFARSPRTIHGFGGFPRELYQLHDPAPSDPGLPPTGHKRLAPTPVW